jgi:FkbM family methyltransferase
MKKVFLDCGANLGQSTEAWIKAIPDASEYEIQCYEASKKLFPILTKNLQKYKNVTLHNKVVWSHSDGVEFCDQGNESSSTEKDKMTGGIHPGGFKRHESINLSEIIKKYSKDDRIVLKIDIEGGEYEVIEHLEATGALSYINEVLIELHAVKLKNSTIEKDYNLLASLKRANITPRTWSAENTMKTLKPFDEDRICDKESIISLWKRKGRYNE